MAQHSEHHRRQTSGWLPVGRAPAVRCGAIATFAVLILMANVASVMGAPGADAFLAGTSVGAGSEILTAPLRQSTTEATDLETPPDSGAATADSRMAAFVAVVNRQGIQGAESLQRVSAIAVPNLMPEPEFVVDARVERAAEANAAAAAAAVAATEVALSVQATVEADAADAASTATARAAIQQAEAEAAASAMAAAAATATATARASAFEAAAALSAKREAEVRAAEVAATRHADALAATVVVSEPKFPDRMSSLLIALTPMLGGVLGLRLWRIKQEPFVLKANSATASSSARA